MGRFDSRNSPKMTRRKRQGKKKARLKRKAEAARAAKTTKPKTKGGLLDPRIDDYFKSRGKP